MKKKILIIDYTTHHPEVVNALCAIFAEHSVTVAVTSSFKNKYGNDLRVSPDRTLVMPKKMSIKKWLAHVAPLIEDQDVIVFSTAIKSPLLLQTLKLGTHAKKIVFVHNTHYLAEKFPLSAADYSEIVEPSATRLGALMRYVSMKIAFFKKSIKRTIHGTSFKKIADLTDFFCFGNEHLARYFTELTGYKNVVTLPTNALNRGLARPPYEGVLRIAIVGSVSPNRRDYESVIRVLGAAQLLHPVELHILGSCPDRRYGEKLLLLLAQLRNSKLAVNFDPDSGFLTTGQLIDKLKNMHLLLSPIKTDFSFQLYREKYGLTKISGAESDCLGFNRPILLPGSYLASKRIQPFVVNYADVEDLPAAIIKLQDAACLDDLYKQSEFVAVEQINKEVLDAFWAKVETC